MNVVVRIRFTAAGVYCFNYRTRQWVPPTPEHLRLLESLYSH
jgi:hypothetical protein